MKIKKYAKKLLLTYYSFLCGFRKPYEYIHLISHPRSGSTLLAHLLINHPDIFGCGETKMIYSKADDFKKLPINVALILRKFPFLGNEKYVLDKLLLDSLITTDNVASIYKKNSCVIFLLRGPKETLDSMSRFPWLHKKRDPKQFVIRWYLNRINTIRRYNKQLKHSECKRIAVLTYDQLLNHTQKVFKLLESVLHLEHPLSESYGLLRTTGIGYFGDFSDNISSGCIVRNREKNKPSLLNFDDQIDRLNQAYHECYRELTQTCLSVDI